eukprot:991925_1
MCASSLLSHSPRQSRISGRTFGVRRIFRTFDLRARDPPFPMATDPGLMNRLGRARETPPWYICEEEVADDSLNESGKLRIDKSQELCFLANVRQYDATSP